MKGGATKNVPASVSKKAPANCYGKYAESGETRGVGGHDPNLGRWPANLIHDGSDEVLAIFPSDAGASAPVSGNEPSQASIGKITGERERVSGAFYADTGSAARFFYCAKASKSDRGDGNTHPTVKPQEIGRAHV